MILEAELADKDRAVTVTREKIDDGGPYVSNLILNVGLNFVIYHLN